jgi:hypothetical protein
MPRYAVSVIKVVCACSDMLYAGMWPAPFVMAIMVRVCVRVFVCLCVCVFVCVCVCVEPVTLFNILVTLL